CRSSVVPPARTAIEEPITSKRTSCLSWEVRSEAAKSMAAGQDSTSHSYTKAGTWLSRPTSAGCWAKPCSHTLATSHWIRSFQDLIISKESFCGCSANGGLRSYHPPPTYTHTL